MADAESDPAPSFRFKRRKLAHPKRARLDDTAPSATPSPLADGSGANDAPDPASALPSQVHADDEEGSVPNLKEILRQRKRPQDRLREAARKAEEKKAKALVQVATDISQTDQWAGRFAAQTGQVIDKDDEQMTKYVEACIAEQNHRTYGWPIPKHLESYVSNTTPTLEQTPPAPPSYGQSIADQVETMVKGTKPARDSRMAAGLGQIQEVDLGPEASARNIQRTEEARRRLAGTAVETPEEELRDKDESGKSGRKRRQPKRRNSEDMRRDMMVEAVLREAKLDYFEDSKPASPPSNSDEAADADEAFYEQFRRDYESQELRNQRKPIMPPGPKNLKEQPKGPKLGGSRSARAAMREKEEQAAKNKR